MAAKLAHLTTRGTGTPPAGGGTGLGGTPPEGGGTPAKRPKTALTSKASKQT